MNIEKMLIVVDMQNDFISGSLGSEDAKNIVGKVVNYTKDFIKNDYPIFWTKDTHFSDYLETKEGKKLPIPHCIIGTEGWELENSVKETLEIYLSKVPCLTKQKAPWVVNKVTFGTTEWEYYLEEASEIAFLGKPFNDFTLKEIHIVGLCTDICVISNAMILAALFPNTEIYVHKTLCAGTSPEAHENALSAMKQCQINIVD